jgi:iron complex outermembrane receptor protein
VKDFSNFKNSDVLFVPNNNFVTLQSYFGRVNYDIREKYYFTGTLRIDGSSKFGPNYKYGTFPAFAFKWKMNKEDFAQNSIGKIFADFGIRANWGKIGSQDGIGAYDAYDLIQRWTPRVTNGTSATSTSLIHQGNADLKWEAATTMGVGLDWTLAGNRLSGTIDYYTTQRRGLLYFGPTPGGWGATRNLYQNLPGYVLNTGLEFSLKYEVIQRSKFNWNIAYNMTFFHNEMRDFNQIVITGAVDGQGLSGAYAQTIQNGQPLFSWKMPEFQGYDSNGYALYADGTKDHIVGTAIPSFTAGLTNNLSYGNWNLSLFFTTSRGFYVYNNTANALFLKGSLKTAHNVTVASANSPESPINPGSVSTRFLEKGDFIRLSNATLSYNFKVSGKVIKSLSANITGQNLFLITNYSGLDPEVNVDKQINGVPSRGFDYAGYPKPRTFTLGLNIGF